VFNRKNTTHYDACRATEQDLETYGLTQEKGIVLAQFQKAGPDFKVNPADVPRSSFKLKKQAPLVCHAGTANTLVKSNIVTLRGYK
jgi:hypothetical protein